MALQFSSLNSGSNGNCYYIGNSQEAILVDVGLSCREVEKRMKKTGLAMGLVKAIFVSHEHGDHIKGVSTLANKYNIPVYITPTTAKNGPILIKHLSKPFTANQPITIGNLSITPFNKKHDAIDPHSFTISCKNVTVGVFTDIGQVCPNVIHHFKQCDAIFLEANYDETMLEQGHYPIHLKQRIRGGLGHLSNKEAVDLFVQHKPNKMKYVILSHLSKENNTPQIAQSLFEKYCNNTSIIVASRYEPTDVFTLTSNEQIITTKKVNHTNQLSLF